jgi:hypothetical protein
MANLKKNYPARQAQASYYVFTRGLSGCMKIRNCVLIFPKTLVLDSSHSKKIKQDMINSTELHVKYPSLLSHFNSTWTLLIYFDICTVHLAQFITQTNKCTIHTHTHTHTHTDIYIYIYIHIYINNILFIVSTPTCFFRFIFYQYMVVFLFNTVIYVFLL